MTLKISLLHFMVCTGMLQMSMGYAYANIGDSYTTHRNTNQGKASLPVNSAATQLTITKNYHSSVKTTTPKALIYGSSVTTATTEANTKPHTKKYTNNATTAATALTAVDNPSNQQVNTANHTALNLPKRLTQYYQPTTDPTTLCTGQWVYPQQQINTDTNSQPTTQQVETAIKHTPAKNFNPLGMNNDNDLNNPKTITAQADYAYYDNQRYAELSGNVHVSQQQKQVFADHLLLDTQSHTAQAKGEVFFANTALSTEKKNLDNEKLNNSQDNTTKPTTETTDNLNIGFMGVAQNLNYTTTNETAKAEQLAFVTLKNQAHGTAASLAQHSNDNLLLTKVKYTTCPPHNPSWVIQADKLSLDNTSGRGEAYDAKLTMGNIPVFYLPYFNFPIDDRRLSGFLLPQAGFSTDGGLQFKLPYYINLAPNYDATVTTTLFTNRNPMASAELRYLTEYVGSGEMVVDYLFKDKQYNRQNRSAIFYNHRWQSKALPALSAKLGYNRVSDADYFNDFDELNYTGNTYNLPRFASLNYHTNQLQASINVETFQTVDSSVPDAKKPYTRLPDVHLDYQFADYAGWQINTQNQATYFKKSIDDGSAVEKSGIRLYDSLNISRPVYQPWGYLKPTLALQSLYTAFDRSSTQQQGLKKGENDHNSVFVPQLTLDAGLNFIKAGSPIANFNQTWATGGYQLLEPRLFYAYAPYQAQEDMPNFNSVAASLSYDQLFEANRFLGRDRLADNNFATLGIDYHYIDSLGYKRLSLALADQFYFADHKVTLNKTDNSIQQSHSGIVTKLASQITPQLQFELNTALQPNNHLNYTVANVAWQPNSNSAISFGLIKRQHNETTNQKPLSALTGSVVMPINQKWRLLAYGQYNNKQNLFQDALVGVNYSSCCYQFTLYGHRYYNDFYNLDSKPNQVIMAELSLTGLGNNASKFANLLKNKVLGFTQTNQAWYKP